MSKKIFLIAGEPSGDALGASLIRALRQGADGPVEFLGIGGPLMEQEGLESLLPMDELCVMGIAEVVFQLPRLLGLINGVVQEINKLQPDAVITIDLPDFNFEVARRLKKQAVYKGKLIHYVAPSVWAWRPGRAKKIAGFLDGLMCLFPFEPSYFSKHGLRAEFVGHPLVESGLDVADPGRFLKDYDIPEGATVVGLFFGSRESEIAVMGDVLKEVGSLIAEQMPEAVLIAPTLPNIEYNLRKKFEGWDVSPVIVANPDYKADSFASCTIAIAVSGTVGLELAYMGIPHVIAYKMSPVTWAAVRMLVKVKFAHLANILLGREAVPEFLQHNCSSLKISKTVLALLKKEDMRQGQISAFGELKSKLTGGESPGLPSKRAADYVWKILGVQ